MNPTLHTAALAALETAINRALKLDPATSQNLGQLDGKVIRLEISGTGTDIYLLPEHNGLLLQGFYDGPIDSHIIGTIADFVELISADDAASALINGGIKLSGDSAPLLQLQGILHRLELDWEGSLARVIGDVPAHQLGKMVRGGMQWGQQAFTSINRQVEEFLHEEARLLPPAAELQEFYDSIANTGLALDRTEARLQRQQQRLRQLQQRRSSGAQQLSLRSALRLTNIIAVTTRHRLDLLLDWHKLPGPARWLLRLSPLRLLPAPDTARGVRIRETLQDLGPVHIKFGQMLSTRRDLLPPDIAEELAKLQDEVPPFDPKQAVCLIEQSLGKPIAELFASFSETPLASASIAQVHAARLHSGLDVVVKVVRPGIDVVIAQDIALLEVLAGLLQRYVPDGRRLRPLEVVEDYKNTIFDELDMQREAANTSLLRRNFIDSNLLYIPEIYWDFTRRNVLVMERIEGIPVSDVEAIRAQGTNMKVLAERGVEIFFTQVFRDNFFHADMHPGNVFISRKNPQQPQYIGIDCAIMGSLSDFDRYYLARNLIAMFDRDYRQVAQLHVECGWVPAQTRVQDFEAAMRSTCEPVFEKPLGEISFGQLLLYLFQTARRFDMEIQPSLVLLQKTMLAIEGLGRDLYPELDLWQTAKPFLDNWMKQRYAPTGMVQQLRQHAPQWLEQLPQLPELVMDNLNRGSETKSLVELQQAQLLQLEQQRQTQRKSRRHLLLALAAAATAVLLAQPELWQKLAQLPTSSLVLLAIAAILLLRG